MSAVRRLSRSSLAIAHRSLLTLILTSPGALAKETSPAETPQFEREVKPVLTEYCFGCHGDGASEGGMSFDDLFANTDREQSNLHWYRVIKQLQAGFMPPAEVDRPSEDQVATILDWIKYGAFGLQRDNPDPGRVTVRRLNQVEYRNTIRDLLGVDYDTEAKFPADDTGHGFDNIGEVLSVSPLLLEKYINAANEIVSIAVPTESAVVRQRTLGGDQFRLDPKEQTDDDADEVEVQEEQPDRFGPARFGAGGMRRAAPPGTTELSYYEEATARAGIEILLPGEYQVRLNLTAVETHVEDRFDLNKCALTFSVDGDVLLLKEFARQGGKDYSFTFDRVLPAGVHELAATVIPLSEEDQIRSLRIHIQSVDLIGPYDEQHFVKPATYERFFPRDVPESAGDRREYARELLGAFAARAFRRRVSESNVDRLVELAESVYGEGNGTFEAGVAKGMTAVLASPRFLFREESLADDQSAEEFPLLDEYSLASRLSYFLWSTMPDDELTALAADNKLRENLDQQIARMLDDEKAQAFVENFVGQWLRARAIETIQINSRSVLRRDQERDPEEETRRRRFFELFRRGDDRTDEEEKEFEEARRAFRRAFRRGARFDLTSELRRSMRRETEMLFEHILKNDRSLLEMVDSDYTFLNGALARHYGIDGIEGVEGEEMRWVELPADSIRGGVLTQGTVLAVTSNPDRTSPVKRGLFILENLLGTPTPAPPPNIPALEDVESDPDKTLTLRATLAIHRENVICSSCHDRMDPLGLALENFNALGRFREAELGQPIDATGILATGESFSSIGQLKQILVTNRKTDIYRCITEKLLTYALGRAVEYWDVHTVDEIVDQLEANNGRASSLIYGVIHSSAFQRTRNPANRSWAAN